MSSSIHCPVCNTQKVMGLGLVIYEQSALVQYKCCDCSELFFLPDQRGQLPAQMVDYASSSKLIASESTGSIAWTDATSNDARPTKLASNK